MLYKNDPNNQPLPLEHVPEVARRIRFRLLEAYVKTPSMPA